MSKRDVNKIFAENLKQLRRERKLYQKDVADALGVSNSIVSDWEKGVKMPRGGAIQKIADLFGISQNQLFIERGAQFLSYKETANVPVVGQVSCGNGTLAYENIERYETIPAEWLTSGEHFLLYAKGDSMINARIYDGDLLLIRKQPDVENGEIAVVLLGGEDAVLKRVYKNGEQLVLQSENPSYAPIFAPPEEVKIIGKLKMNIIKY